MMQFSYATRSSELTKAKGSMFDVLIVGGGIIGAGVANALSQAGIRVILVEKGDFASGTSSKSSKLIHGGLRYLAQGRIRLTKSLLKERNYLVKHTPVVKEEKFDILVGGNQFGKLSIRLGLILYGMLGGGKPSRLKKNDGLYPVEIEGYFTYTDCVTDDSYLTILNVVSAHQNNAICLNYVSCLGMEKNENGIRAKLQDKLTGEIFDIRSRMTINCAGAWITNLLPETLLDLKLVRLSKGIHLIYPRNAFPGSHAVAFKSPIDGRQMFVIPREKVVIIGTTDTFTDSPDDLSVKPGERDYVIKSCSFISSGFSSVSPIGEYAGIRTLYGNGDSPGKLSRDFKLISDDISITVIGGKVTDYRRVAHKVAKMVTSRIHAGKVTPDLPRLDYAGLPGLNTIESAVNFECAMTVDDILYRRTGTCYFDPENAEKVRDQLQSFLEKNNVKLEKGYFCE